MAWGTSVTLVSIKKTKDFAICKLCPPLIKESVQIECKLINTELKTSANIGTKSRNTV